MDLITLPPKKSRIPGVPKWEAVEQFFTQCPRLRDKAMLALMVYGGLRRSEVVRLNVGDYQEPFGLRRVLGKGGHETTVPLPEVARVIVSEYLAKERPGAAASEPLFLVQYRWYGGEKKTRRMSGQRVWKIIKDLGKRVGVDTIHPHAFRHRVRSSCSSVPAATSVRCRSIYVTPTSRRRRSTRGSRRTISSAS
jgi:integrase/recombinase XerD